MTTPNRPLESTSPQPRVVDVELLAIDLSTCTHSATQMGGTRARTGAR